MIRQQTQICPEVRWNVHPWDYFSTHLPTFPGICGLQLVEEMHLLILGATGRTGVYGYEYALEQGIWHSKLNKIQRGI